MATVYLARHPALNRDVAIKVLHPHLVQQPGLAERFQREAQTIAALRHPNIVQVHDFDVSGDVAYLVMEYVPGVTLAAQLRLLNTAGQLMPLAQAEATFTAIAKAVACAHQNGVIHRDLKPANVLLREDGTPVLTDFGLVLLLEGTRYTQPDAAPGTPAYMSPEQCSGEPVDARSDIYALGVLLFELVTGQLPFQADSLVQIIVKQITAAPPAPSRFRSGLPPQVEQAILCALAKKPAERFATVNGMLAALQDRPPITAQQANNLGLASLTLSPPPNSSSHSLQMLFTDDWVRHVKAAFASYDSLLELAQSPLAAPPLITPALILNDAAPTPDERGRALRLILRWAVNRLAPAPPRYPIGAYRPPDDPTWKDRLWWRYNLLRHRYLEPLHPDERLDEYGLIDSLIALTLY
jgi:serine/threonine protein kinase